MLKINVKKKMKSTKSRILRNKKIPPISQKNENIEIFCPKEVDKLKKRYKLKEVHVKLQPLDFPLDAGVLSPDHSRIKSVRISPIRFGKIDEAKKLSWFVKSRSSSLKQESRNCNRKLSPFKKSVSSSICRLLEARKKKIRAISSSSSSEDSDESDKLLANTQFRNTLAKKSEACVKKHICTESIHSDEGNWKEDTAFELFLQCTKSSISPSPSENLDENDKSRTNSQFPTITRNRRGFFAKQLCSELRNGDSASKYSCDDRLFPMTLRKKGNGSKLTDDDSEFSLTLRRSRRNCVAQRISAELQNANTVSKYSKVDDDYEEDTDFELLSQRDRSSSSAKRTFINDSTCEGNPLPRFVTRKFTSPSKICLDSSSEDSDIIPDDSSDDSVNNKNTKSKVFEQVPNQESSKSIVDNVPGENERHSIERQGTAKINVMKRLCIQLKDQTKAKTKLSFHEDPVSKSQKKEILPNFCTTSTINFDELVVTVCLPGEPPVRVPAKQMTATFKMSPEVIVKNISHQFSFGYSKSTA